MRAEQGAGLVTLGINIGEIKMIITHAVAVSGLDIAAPCCENAVAKSVCGIAEIALCVAIQLWFS